MLVVNLFGGPGVSKSTTATGIFHDLKKRGINCEYVPEFAKSLVWAERHRDLDLQPYVTVSQWRELAILEGKVEIVVTDSPILLGCVYQYQGRCLVFENFIRKLHEGFNSLNVFLERDLEWHPYQENGRLQTIEQSIEKDEQILKLLSDFEIPFSKIKVGPSTVDEIVRNVLSINGR